VKHNDSFFNLSENSLNSSREGVNIFEDVNCEERWEVNSDDLNVRSTTLENLAKKDSSGRKSVSRVFSVRNVNVLQKHPSLDEIDLDLNM